MAKGGKREGAGRKKLDKTLLLVASLARDHTEEAVSTLVELMRKGEPSIRKAAADSILDRGWGKPAQAVTGEDGGPVQVLFGWLPVSNG